MKDEALSKDIIKQSRLPAAKQPPPGEPAKVEREDWPGPPFPPLYDRHRSKSLGDLEGDEKEVRASGAETHGRPSRSSKDTSDEKQAQPFVNGRDEVIKNEHANGGSSNA